MVEISNSPILQGLSYLFSHSDGKTIAHCLNLDLVASGKDLREAEDCLNTLVLVQISSCFESGNLSQFKCIAPMEYWNEIKNAKPLASSCLEVEVPPIVLPVERYKTSLPVSRFEMELAA